MTTKWKVITGFFVLMVLLATTVCLGYIKLAESSAGFARYEVEAVTAVYTYAAETLLNRSRNRVAQYMLTNNPEEINAVQTFTNDATKEITEARKIETDPQEAAVLDKQVDRIRQFASLAR